MDRSQPGRWYPRSAVSVVAAVVAAACVAAVAVLAIQSPGYAGSSVRSTTRVVWVTNATQFLLGRINRQIDELDSAVALSSADFDVVQDGREVFAIDGAAHQLRQIDPATVTLSQPLGLPDHATVALGGGVLAIGDVATGRIWTRPAGDMGTGDITDTPPVATVAPGVVLAVGTDGSVAATAPGQNRLTIIGGGDGGDGGGDGSVRAIPLGRTLSEASQSDPAPIGITMVGTRPVVLDRPAGELIIDGRTLPLPRKASGATLQQSGADSDAVLVATSTALLRIDLADGATGRFAPGTSGTPIAPVWLDGCAHAAWAGAHPTYLAWCGGTPAIRPIPTASGPHPPGSLVFRVNRSEIVLNDITTGDTYLLDRQMTVINNWSEVAPPRHDQADDRDNTGNEDQSNQATLSRTNCAGVITPPTAAPDRFGVRAGRPAILPVTANDATTDCAAVTIASVSGWTPEVGTVAVVDGGRSLQVTTAGTTTTTAPGTLPPLTYQLSDGAGHSSRATVQVSVVPAGSHPRPARLRGSATMVGVGGTVTDNVLADWYSPAGDPLWLTAVHAQTRTLAVGFEPGGAITVHDTGSGGPGKRTVTFALTDGVNVAHGTLSVQVVAPDDAAPIASPVFVRTAPGRPVTVRLLDHVLAPGTDQARITAVRPDKVDGKAPAGLHVSEPSETGVVTIRATTAGDYGLHYQVAARALSAQGVIRILVAGGTAPAPVAVTDVGYLAPDGQVRIDLTGNDLADGRVLAVQQVHVDAGSPLLVTISDMHVAHVSARRPLPDGGAWFSYTDSDGHATATGWVHIIPVTHAAGQGPMASPARMTVRAGDAGTLPIGQVAMDRDGNAMTVQPFTPLPAGQGLLFAAGDEIRYLAPDTPPTGDISAVYTVTDTAGLSDSAPLHITVLPRGNNHRPATPPIATARVFAGGSVTVAPPLDGIDPDGDWVTITGVKGGGMRGTAAVSGPDSITYTALDTPGSDTVTYTAADPSGASVTGKVDVVVVPQPDVARPPVAPDLKVTVAPGHSIGVDVLGAVSDPAGLPVTFAPGGAAVAAPARSGVTARIADGVLVVTAGAKPVVVPVGYTVVNTRGLSASGVVTVTVNPDAEPVPPTATDVFVDSPMLSSNHRTVVVDLTDHVANPGGLPEDLTASVPRIDSTVARATGRLQITVPLTGSRQVIAYRVTNTEKLTASAFIVVPSREELIPHTADTAHKPAPLRPSVSPLRVDAGTTATVDIPRYVSGAPAGRTIIVPASAHIAVSAGHVRRVDATHLAWTIPDDAPHQGWLRTDVTDGKATPVRVTIPATIKPAVPPPPQFKSTEVTVAAGGSTTVHLAPLATPGKKGEKLTFAGPTGAGHGVRATLHGSTLTVSADGTATKGSRVDLTVTVSDGIHPPVKATVRVTVVASTAPVAWIPDISVDGEQGATQQIDVLDHARNPLPDKGPLRLVGASVDAGHGDVSYTAGGTVSITPSDSQVGPLVVQVTVADATGDPDRRVTATVTVTVAGRPGRVTGVDVVSSGDRFVELEWQAPPDNGREITSYTVKSTSGSFHQTCDPSPTRCKLTGLTNNVSYRFTVTARNDVGDSPASAPSPAVKPDVAPEAPRAPTLDFGDGSITATWHRPVDRGSPITEYLVTISPAPRTGSPTVAVRHGTRHTFTHLDNGTSYEVTVVARNSSGTDSDSSPSARMTPAAKPGVPGTPGLTYDADAGTVAVSWTPAAGHGDDELTYRVAWTGDDGTHGTVTVKPGKRLRATISPAKLGVTYSATVTATNKAGTSKASDSGDVRAFTAVGPPGDVTAVASGDDQTVTVTWSAPDYSGWNLSAYQYQIDGQGAWTALPVATSATIHDTALTDGAKHTVAIRACTQQAANACGKAATSGSVVPYGPPGVVSGLTAAPGDGSYTLTWSAADGNGRDIAGYQYSTDSGTTWKDSDHGTDTSITLAGSNGSSYTVAVRAYHSKDDGGAAGPASAAVTVTPYGPPGQVTGLRATSVGDRSFTLSWTAPSGNGRPIAGYQWTKDGGSTWTNTGSASTSKSFTATNGTTYSIAVRAYNSESADTYGAASDPVTVTPYGPVGKPSVRASGGNKKVSFSWSGPADNGLGPYRYEINGGSSTTKTSTSVSVACGKSASISVVAVDSEGHKGPAGTASARADACPPSYPLGKVGSGGAPTFASLYNLTPDGNVGTNGSAYIKCWNPIHLIDSDDNEGWFKIASGKYADHWIVANTLDNMSSVKSQVAGVSCPRT